MSRLTTQVGLDFHQSSVQVCVLDSQGKQLTNRSVENDRVESLHSRFRDEQLNCEIFTHHYAAKQ